LRIGHSPGVCLLLYLWRGQYDLAEAIAELREMAGGRNDILAEAAGVTQGLGMPRRPPSQH
jgi:hypothetical protein